MLVSVRARKRLALQPKMPDDTHSIRSRFDASYFDPSLRIVPFASNFYVAKFFPRLIIIIFCFFFILVSRCESFFFSTSTSSSFFFHSLSSSSFSFLCWIFCFFALAGFFAYENKKKTLTYIYTNTYGKTAALSF